MSRVAELAKAGRSPVAKFHELRLKYWNSDIEVICCFEGGDDIEFYYSHVLRELNLSREQAEFVSAGGKGVVLKLYEWVRERAWNLARVGFFVDRDLDMYLTTGVPAGEQIYVTDHYSIESHVADDAFFDSVWQELFHLPITDPRYAQWRQAYIAGCSQFALLLRPLLSAALAAKRAGAEVDFDHVNLENFVRITPEGSVERKRGPSGIPLDKVFRGPVATRENIRRSREALLGNHYQTWLRGKFLLWYSMRFFARMKAKLSARGQPARVVTRFQFSDDSGISCLCARTSAPPSLLLFLRGWAAKIAGSSAAPAGDADWVPPVEAVV